MYYLDCACIGNKLLINKKEINIFILPAILIFTLLKVVIK